ncbi:MAG TPA: hypothetical protein P5319_10740, partial [Gemmatimonadales bacterium]|nr:hypothetical protein [Gemmatimonadales bacterium]
SIPELSVQTSGFGGAAAPGAVPAPVTLAFGSGVTITKTGTTLTTTTPGAGTVTQAVTLNADGLPTRAETFANGSSHALTYVYGAGSGRYPANGAAQWGKVTRITYPDGSWERLEYHADTGWLAKQVFPFKDAAPGDPDSVCRVTTLSYDSSISAGDPDDPLRLVERPRRAVTTTLGLETAREYHAYGTDPDGRRVLHTRRCATPGAAWDAPDNLESTTRFNRFGPPDVETPTGWVLCTAGVPHDDRLVITQVHSSGLSMPAAPSTPPGPPKPGTASPSPSPSPTPAATPSAASCAPTTRTAPGRSSSTASGTAAHSATAAAMVPPPSAPTPPPAPCTASPTTASPPSSPTTTSASSPPAATTPAL